MTDAAILRALDRRHVWHPYAGIPPSMEPLLVSSAVGVRLQLTEPVAGHTELIDGMSSWWAAIHGYGHPVLDVAAHEQIDRMSHVMFGGLTHEPAIRLAARLVDITPDPLQHVFFSDSGSVAVEVAIKMALQYWRAAGEPAKTRLMTWRGGYHGDTFHPMSVCDPHTGMHHMWSGVLPDQLFADAPPAGFDAPISADYVQHLSSLLAAHADELAAVIIEPVVQGAGGMQFHNPEYVTVLRELTARHDVLLIVDEIATGFGRTGELFAVDHADVDPDIMCVGKALTAGYIGMAATLCSSAIAGTISSSDIPVLAHGPTFMANPLACAIADASVNLLLSQDWKTSIKRIETVFTDELAAASHVPGVRDVRVLGGIGVVQMDHPVDMQRATAAAVEHGVWLRPFGDMIYSLPPYITDDDELHQIASAIVAAAQVA